MTLTVRMSPDQIWIYRMKVYVVLHIWWQLYHFPYVKIYETFPVDMFMTWTFKMNQGQMKIWQPKTVQAQGSTNLFWFNVWKENGSHLLVIFTTSKVVPKLQYILEILKLLFSVLKRNMMMQSIICKTKMFVDFCKS